MKWFEKFDLEKNPFDSNPINIDFKLIDKENESKEILYRIISGSMLLIEGEEGTGKTSLLKYAIDNFRGKGKVVYIDAKKLSKRLNINKIIKKKGMILLIDNVQELSKYNNERIKYYFDEDYIRAVVFTTTDFETINFTDAIKDRIGKSIIKLSPLKENTAVEIVKSRLGNIEIMPENVIKQLFQISKDMTEFIRKCNLLCDYVVNSEKDIASLSDIKQINDEGEKEDESSKYCEDCKSELIKVGDFWRCEICDSYCTACGALVAPEDEVCPNCEVEFEESK